MLLMLIQVQVINRVGSTTNASRRSKILIGNCSPAGGTAANAGCGTAPAQAGHSQGGDAELYIGGVLTRWTKVRNALLVSTPPSCQSVCECHRAPGVSTPLAQRT